MQHANCHSSRSQLCPATGGAEEAPAGFLMRCRSLCAFGETEPLEVHFLFISVSIYSSVGFLMTEAESYLHLNPST